MDQDYEIIKEMIIDALGDIWCNYNHLFENGEVDEAKASSPSSLLGSSMIDFHFGTESGKSYVGIKVKTSKGYRALRVNRRKAIEISNIIELEFPTLFEEWLKKQGKKWLIEEVRRR